MNEKLAAQLVLLESIGLAQLELALKSDRDLDSYWELASKEEPTAIDRVMTKYWDHITEANVELLTVNEIKASHIFHDSGISSDGWFPRPSGNIIKFFMSNKPPKQFMSFRSGGHEINLEIYNRYHHLF